MNFFQLSDSTNCPLHTHTKDLFEFYFLLIQLLLSTPVVSLTSTFCNSIERSEVYNFNCGVLMISQKKSELVLFVSKNRNLMAGNCIRSGCSYGNRRAEIRNA